MRLPTIVLVAVALMGGALFGFFGALVIIRSSGNVHDEPPGAATEALPVSQPDDAVQTRAPEAPPTSEPSPAPVKAVPVQQLAISVTGAVVYPGVYRFEFGKRVQDAIDAAGGLASNADLDDINIAARLQDNTTLYIPFQVITTREGGVLAAKRTAAAADMNPARYTRSGWAGHTPPAPLPQRETPVLSAPSLNVPAPTTSESGTLINLNTASLTELQQLPGVGPKTAEKIIAHRQERPFGRVEDLLEVHGIGDKKMEAVRHLVTVE